MESWRTLYSFYMQTRTIDWSKVQKFKEFGQGLNKVGKHHFAIQQLQTVLRSLEQSTNLQLLWLPGARSPLHLLQLQRDWFHS